MKCMTLLLIGTLFFTPLAAEEPAKLTVEGQATLQRPADQITFSAGVVTVGRTADDALSENSEKMQQVLSALQQAGLEKSEFKTGRFSIHPTYTPYPKNPPPEWQPTINGYEVRNSILIKTEKLRNVGALIDAASGAGANAIDHIEFGLKDDRAYWDEAIVAATQNAIADAKTMAKAAGVELRRLLSITLNHAKTDFPTPIQPTFFRAKASAENQTPIEPGNLEVKASVTVVYEIG